MPKQADRGSGSAKRAVSERKVQANRRNALQSSGPRTLRGKAFSRRNALKDGLFAMRLVAFDRGESENYEALLDQLANYYQPVGVAEQLEVERIAVCWWKLGRAWRYENAELSLGQVNVAHRLHRQASRDILSSEERARLDLLRRAESEIETTGKMSAAVEGKLFDADPAFREQWNAMKELAQEKFGEAMARAEARYAAEDGPATESTSLLLMTTALVIYSLENKAALLVQSVSATAYDRVAIPLGEILDRILRAESAAERNLSRAIDRLERLQRQRKGEAIPPPVSVRLTR